VSENIAVNILKLGPAIVLASALVIAITTYLMSWAKSDLSSREKQQTQQEFSSVIDAVTKPSEGIERLIEKRISILTDLHEKVPNNLVSEGVISRATERVAQLAEKNRLLMLREEEKRNLEAAKIKENQQNSMELKKVAEPLLALVKLEKDNYIAAMKKAGLDNDDWGPQPSLIYHEQRALIRGVEPAELHIGLDGQISIINVYTANAIGEGRIGSSEGQANLIFAIRKALDMHFEERLIVHLSQKSSQPQ